MQIIEYFTILFLSLIIKIRSEKGYLVDFHRAKLMAMLHRVCRKSFSILMSLLPRGV